MIEGSVKIMTDPDLGSQKLMVAYESGYGSTPLVIYILETRMPEKFLLNKKGEMFDSPRSFDNGGCPVFC